MNKPPVFLFLLLIWCGHTILPAQPAWTHRYGGLGSDYAYSLAQAADGSLYIGGFSCSQISGDKSENSRGHDFWVVKTNAEGKLLWEKTAGGEGNDLLTRLKIRPDGSLLALGASDSSPSAGGFQDPTNGDWDVKIALLSADSQLVADHSIGGPGPDWPGDILPTADHHWLLAYSSRNAPDSIGGFDGRLAKTDTLGNILWSKTYGGTADDFFSTLIATADSGCLLGGKSFSQPPSGNGDIWIVRVTAGGDTLWNAHFGGDQEEWIGGIQPLPDGGFLVAAYSASGVSGNKTTGGNGTRNFWLFKIDENGVKVWEKTYLAPGDQELNGIQPTCGGFLLGGTTHAGNSKSDFIVMKINEAGDLLWTLTAGGNREDIGTALLAFDDHCLLAGSGASTDVAAPAKGSADYLLAKLAYPPGQACIVTGFIPLQKGWNLVSSAIRPGEPDMLAVLQPHAALVQILRDADARVVIPAPPPNTLNQVGDWNVAKGYQVKAYDTGLLPVTGLRVTPSQTPVPINTGWQMIPYLRGSPGKISDYLAGIANLIILVKDNWGSIYAPQWGIDSIVQLLSGQGYWLKANGPGVLVYADNVHVPPADELSGLKTAAHSGPAHFDFHPVNTGNNATLIVPAAVAAGVLASGDEIGVFSPGGILCGAAVYTGQNLALTLWGDDPATDTVEYLAANEVFGLKTWKAPTGEEPDAVFDLESGDAVYETNGIYVLAQLSEAVGVPEVRGLAGFRYFPNPAEGRLHVQFQLETAERLRLELISAGGMNVATLFDRDFPAGATGHACDVAAWPDGWYFLRLTAATGSAAYPLILKQQ